MTRGLLACVGAVALAAIGIPAVVAFPTKLVWNASPSAPIGLYDIRAVDRLAVGDLVAVDPPEPIARFIAERGYLPPDIPLLKHVVALPGQTVCRTDNSISVDGVALGDALDHDRMGRPMPVWQGCERIAEGEIFLMNRDALASLDGRYFGSIPTDSVIGTATPLWNDADGTGRHRWRTEPR